MTDVFASLRRPVAPRPWPLAPLLDATKLAIYPLAKRIQVPWATVAYWSGANLTDEQADHAAIACGLHPILIWLDWIDRDLEDAA